MSVNAEHQNAMENERKFILMKFELPKMKMKKKKNEILEFLFGMRNK